MDLGAGEWLKTSRLTYTPTPTCQPRINPTHTFARTKSASASKTYSRIHGNSGQAASQLSVNQ
jgi:hypothetical protein